MASHPPDKAWDFRAASGVSHERSNSNADRPAGDGLQESQVTTTSLAGTGVKRLGDFSRVWRYLEALEDPKAGELSSSDDLLLSTPPADVGRNDSNRVDGDTNALREVTFTSDSAKRQLMRPAIAHSPNVGAKVAAKSSVSALSSPSTPTSSRKYEQFTPKAETTLHGRPSTSAAPQYPITRDRIKTLPSSSTSEHRKDPSSQAVAASAHALADLHASLERQYNPAVGTPARLELNNPNDTPVVSNPMHFPIDAVRVPSSVQLTRGAGRPAKTRATPQTPEEQRHVEFIRKLREAFPEDRQWLLPKMQLTGKVTPDSIHVFVDMSNIRIGYDGILLKPGTDMSFHSLAFFLERCRPVAKRALVGSTREGAPNLSHQKFIDMAAELGYETRIYERVLKTKGLNSRKKWCEQGVDESLHLQMLESIVDTKDPSTIVLATGDGAEAEFSKGFFAMVERALKKGWSVELVSWKGQLSGLYRDKEFQAKWGDKFRVLLLDNFVEFMV